MKGVPAWVWYAGGGLLAWMAFKRWRGTLRGDRPASENDAYAIANNLVSSPSSSIGSDLYDLLHRGQVDPSAPVTYRVGADGLTYASRVNLYSIDGILLRTVPFDEIPRGFKPKPVIVKATGQPVVFRAVQTA